MTHREGSVDRDVDNTHETARGRGRPRGFEESDVVGAAVMVFWEHGYESTTASMLSQATGLNTSSLYNAFGSKYGLFVRAVEMYRSMLVELFTPLEHGERGLADIAQFFDDLRVVKTDDGAIGSCLVANTIAEGVEGHEVAKETAGYLQQLTGGFRSALERSVDLGEVSGEAPVVLPEMLAHTVIGLLVGTRVRRPPFDDGVVDGVIASLDRWRV